MVIGNGNKVVGRGGCSIAQQNLFKYENNNVKCIMITVGFCQQTKQNYLGKGMVANYSKRCDVNNGSQSDIGNLKLSYRLSIRDGGM